jgi:hypothetical protein
VGGTFMKMFSVFAVIIFIQGCSFYDTKKQSTSDYLENPKDKISQVVFESGESVEFDRHGGSYYKLNNCIAGPVINVDKNYVSVPLNKIKVIETSKGILSLSEFLLADTTEIRAIALTNNDVYNFRHRFGGGHYYKYSIGLIAGVDTNGTFYQLGTDSISYIYISKINTVKVIFASLGCVAGTAGVIVVIALLTKRSCPFIYSFDGSRYVFDKEPLGGATAPILQRTDLSKLKYLKESNGKYKLLITNEVDETQNIDKLKLTYIDHNKGESVYPDIHNNIYLINKETLPTAVTDKNGKDLMPFFKSDDGVYWKSKMANNAGEIKDKTRDEIFLSFIRPKGSDKCNLIINAGTTLWGSNMIKEMLLLYGSSLDDYYQRINKGGDDYNAMMSFLQKEELFQLKLYAKVEGEWKYKTTVNGGGPFKSETRVYPIDISDIKGDTIMFKVEPPEGFWTFDYAAADFSPIVHPKSYTLNTSKAVDNNSKNIESSLTSEDKDYYSMPDTSNYFYAEFNAPLLTEGKERTIFASTTGWYEIHIPKTGNPNWTQVLKFVSEPGSIIKYSNNKYIEWINKNNLSLSTK